MTADPGSGRSPLRVFTIATHACADRVRPLETKFEHQLEVLILDEPGSRGLRDVLGEEWERYAVGFDARELALAVLPRILAGALADGAAGAAYVDALSDLRGDLDMTGGDVVRIDPWPVGGDRDVDRMGVVVVPATASARELLSRWSRLVSRLLGEDRSLTTATTLRWIEALGSTLPGLDVLPGGITGHVRDAECPYGFDSLPGGLPLTPALRWLLRRGPFDRPWSECSEPELLAWLGEPASAISDLPRYLAALRDQRSDLSEAFSAAPDAELLAWAEAHGRAEDRVLAALIPERSSATHALSDAASEPSAELPGVNAVGFWSSELGIADAARLVVSALRSAHVPVQPIAVLGSLPPSRHRVAFAAHEPDSAPFDVNVLALNPDGLLAFREEAGERFFAGRPSVGYWWWEIIDAFPEAWRPAFELVDEVWVGSRHVRDAIEPASPVPVRLVPIPVQSLAGRRPRSQFGLPDGFLFVTMFDYNSAFERKDPLATVRAFEAAFAPGSGASLVVKSINAVNAPDNRDELEIVAGAHPDVHVMDRYMRSDEIDALLACADCVVSLHRAEGFGIPLARALRSGIPVVATGYGGNLDFMNDDNSYLVDHRPATVPEANIYPAGARWAQPSIDHAAAQLRRVFDDPAEARRRAAVGAAMLRESFSTARTGARMAAELKRLRDQVPQGRGGAWTRLTGSMRGRRRA